MPYKIPLPVQYGKGILFKFPLDFTKKARAYSAFGLLCCFFRWKGRFPLKEELLRDFP